MQNQYHACFQLEVLSSGDALSASNVLLVDVFVILGLIGGLGGRRGVYVKTAAIVRSVDVAGFFFAMMVKLQDSVDVLSACSALSSSV